jgi:hypothetical protein
MSDVHSSPPKPLYLSPSARGRRPITVGVGYSWRGKVQNDLRWKALSKFLNAVGEQARKRAVRELNKGGASNLPLPRIRRLRASVGELSWAGIQTAISKCDILVFDITPTKRISPSARANRRVRQTITSSNVWLELGYALGQKKRVFVVHSKAGGLGKLPADHHTAVSN